MCKSFILSTIVLTLLVAGVSIAQLSSDTQTGDRIEGPDPISAVGHGAMLDAEGKPIAFTREFALEAQRHYLTRLTLQADEPHRSALREKQKRVLESEKWTPQDQVYLSSVLIDWLIGEVKPVDASRLRSINAFLCHQLLIDMESPSREGGKRGPAYAPPRRLLDRLRREGLQTRLLALRSTILSGASYVSLCRAQGVPKPPDWGSSQWVSQGVLSPDFIGFGKVGEVFTFESSTPRGICIALPRSQGNTIILLGIICQGNDTGKACFWDNQRNDISYDIPKNTNVPLTDFAGGAELEGGNGGVCTDCHAGENPFIVHPASALNRGLMLNPTKWVEPLVHPLWPQNDGPSNLVTNVSLSTGDGSCLACHAVPRQFPVLSTALSGYCGILNMALVPGSTMPPGALTADFSKHINALKTACAQPLSDSDGDGITDQKDNCQTLSSTNQSDQDGDGKGDVCDDSDGDGLLDSVDNCYLSSNVNQADKDADGTGDTCDDSDGDGVFDATDNCWYIRNSLQNDGEGDGIGDACDVDDDNDGICYPPGLHFPNTPGAPPQGCSRDADNCPIVANPTQLDTDTDGLGDACDTCPLVADTGFDTDGDGQDNACDPDDDNDGVPDEKDNCSTVKNPGQQDINGNGIGRACDPDEHLRFGPQPHEIAGALEFRRQRFERYQIPILPDLDGFGRGGIPRNPVGEIRVQLDIDLPVQIVDGEGRLVIKALPGETKVLRFSPDPEFLADLGDRPGASELTAGKIQPRSGPRYFLEIFPSDRVIPGRSYKVRIEMTPGIKP